MGQFDQAARYTAKLDPPAFFGWLLPGFDAALAFRGWLDARTLPFPGEPDRTCDTVAELLDAASLGRLWALVVEFQSEPDPEILDRLLEYMVRLRREVRHGPEHRIRYLTAACLVNLTGPAQAGELDMALPCTDEVHLRFRPRVRTLRDDDAGAVLRDIKAGIVGRAILPWIPLMHGGGDSDTIVEWKRVAGLEPDRKLRTVYAALAFVFAELATCRVEWKQGLEGWNMRQSMVITEWQNEARAEGRLEGLRTALLNVLQVRFPVPTPTDLAATIQGCSDSDELNRWLKIAATVSSLDAFRTAVSSNGAMAQT